MNELYGGEERSIPVDGSPEQAARRLEGRTQRWAGLTFMDKVIGAITVDRVVMLRRHRSGRNGFAPVFRGRFELVRGRTYLTGYFGLRRSAQAFTTLWFCFVAAFCVATVVVGGTESSKRGAPLWLAIVVGMISTFPGLALGLLGFAALRFGKRSAEADIAQIVDHVESSFAKMNGRGHR